MALAYPFIFHMKMHQLINLDFCAAFNFYLREKLTVSSCRRTFSMMKQNTKLLYNSTPTANRKVFAVIHNHPK